MFVCATKAMSPATSSGRVCVCGVSGAVREGVSEIESVYFFFC